MVHSRLLRLIQKMDDATLRYGWRCSTLDAGKRLEQRLGRFVMALLRADDGREIDITLCAQWLCLGRFAP